MNYLRAQVNFRQLRAETAGNRYLRRFLPATAGIFTCGSVYLRPSQVNLHAPVLQCLDMGLFSVSRIELFSVTDWTSASNCVDRGTTLRLNLRSTSSDSKSSYELAKMVRQSFSTSTRSCRVMSTNKLEALSGRLSNLFGHDHRHYRKF